MSFIHTRPLQWFMNSLVPGSGTLADRWSRCVRGASQPSIVAGKTLQAVSQLALVARRAELFSRNKTVNGSRTATQLAKPLYLLRDR